MVKYKVERPLLVGDLQLPPVGDFAADDVLDFAHVDHSVRVSLVDDERKGIVGKQRLLVIVLLLPDQGFFAFSKLAGGDDETHAVAHKETDGGILVAIGGEHGGLGMTGVEEFGKFLHDGLETDV